MGDPTGKSPIEVMSNSRWGIAIKYSVSPGLQFVRPLPPDGGCGGPLGAGAEGTGVGCPGLTAGFDGPPGTPVQENFNIFEWSLFKFLAYFGTTSTVHNNRIPKWRLPVFHCRHFEFHTNCRREFAGQNWQTCIEPLIKDISCDFIRLFISFDLEFLPSPLDILKHNPNRLWCPLSVDMAVRWRNNSSGTAWSSWVPLLKYKM